MKKKIRLLIAMMVAAAMLVGSVPIFAEETVEEQQPADVIVEVTAEPTAAPTPEPTAAPTKAPTPEPTAVPTEEPTPEPTAVPTEEPTPDPTAVPTEEPTPEPTAVPTEEPTPEPTEAPAVKITPEPVEEKVAFSAKIEIKPEKKELYYDDVLKIEVIVKDANMGYELKWESLDPSLPEEDQKWETFSKDNPLKMKLTEKAPTLNYKVTLTGENGETISKDFKLGTPTYRVEEPAEPVEPAAEEPAEPVEPAAEEPAEPVEPAAEEPAEPVEPAAEEPAEPVEPAAEEPAEPVEPAAEEPAEPVEPAAEEPAEPVEPAAEEPAEPVEPAAEEPAEPVEPAAEESAEPVEPAAEEPAEPVEPAVEEPAEPVEPAVEEPAEPTEPADSTYIKEETPAETTDTVIVDEDGENVVVLDITGTGENEETVEETADEEIPTVNVQIFSSFNGVISLGEPVVLTSVVDGEVAGYQWECDKGNGFEVVEGATEPTYSFAATAESLKWNWRLTVTTPAENEALEN